jgi:DNA-binding GntR family transcriptional regulator
VVERHPLSPALSADLRQIVYEKIKEAIVDGILPPGERLSEVDLAMKLNVSRTPVREAIRQLAQTGLVRLVPRRGAFVTLPTAKDASDLYEIRIALETLALERVCSVPPEEELRALRAGFLVVTDESEGNPFLADDRHFHALLSRSSGNGFLETVLHNVSDLIQLCRHYSIDGVPLPDSAQEHVAIIDAILEQNTPLAKELMTRHLIRAKDALISYIHRHPEFASAQPVTLTA